MPENSGQSHEVSKRSWHTAAGGGMLELPVRLKNRVYILTSQPSAHQGPWVFK